MSTSFVARFDTTPLSLKQVLDAIGPVIANHEIIYSGSLIELVPHGAWPTIGNLNFQNVGMGDAAKAASSWWGVGLSCISKHLVKEIGRGSASEVDLSFFRGPKNQWTLHYSELSMAADHRIESEESNQDLIALQTDLCRVAKFKLSLYQEEDTDGLPTVSLRNVESAIKQIAGDIGSESSIVVSTELMDLNRGHQLAGSRADEVRQSNQGFIVFPFLTGYPK